MILTVTLNPALDLAMEVPTLEYGGMSRATNVRKEAAGKGINVSRMLKILGEPTTALALLGQSSVGDFQRLARETGLAIVYVLVPGETRTNIHIQEQQGGRAIKVNQPGLAVDETQFAHFTMLFRRQLRGA
ncbi:MAG: 1-phosphofructokinase, partial [Candidatus Sumerlaeia bacterium]|nr:1-phosphofructokinase [Candidatus Sumerlaeia bacterium]